MFCIQDEPFVFWRGWLNPKVIDVFLWFSSNDSSCCFEYLIWSARIQSNAMTGRPSRCNTKKSKYLCTYTTIFNFNLFPLPSCTLYRFFYTDGLMTETNEKKAINTLFYMMNVLLCHLFVTVRDSWVVFMFVFLWSVRFLSWLLELLWVFYFKS